MDTLHRDFVRTAKRLGKKTAIVDRTLDRHFTYSKALIAALILVRKLHRYRDGYIGLMIPNSAGSFLATLGVVMAGKVPVMINYSTGAAENAEYAQNKCGFRTIITSRALLEKIGCRIVKGMVFIEDILAEVSVADKIRAAAQAALPLPLLLRSIHGGELDDNAVILFTSGSEKDPKAVQLTHRNFQSNIEGSLDHLELTEEDNILSILPLFHVFGHNTNFWLPLVTGCTAVTYANPLDYEIVCRIVREEKITVMLGTPIFFSGYLRKSRPGDFTTVRLAVAGADKTPEQLYKGFLEKHNLQILEGYGCTETSPVISVNTPNHIKPGSIGKPLSNVEVRIQDINTGEDLSPGNEGKIVVRGDLVMKGYFDDIEETALRIRGGWYDTGDMGMLDEEGYLWHRGRLKRFVKIGGEMVSLVRTEIVLNQLLPEDVDCCVVEVADSVKGARIVAAVTAPVNEKKILKAMARELPNIALPRRFEVMEELPKMGSGKADFRAVQAEMRRKIDRGRNQDG
jgi:acyl-[acyl-carrier-protein]-phospholipid O-acyltransferase/long-chain-fatty-acid--[acyl-carrier-protein] ligase